jgi:nucleotide-binding universal stress UspA family protein
VQATRDEQKIDREEDKIMTHITEPRVVDGLRILVLLPEPETVAAALDCAIAASRGREARIEAVQIGFDPDKGIVSAEELDIQQIRAVFEGTAADRRARVRGEFDAWQFRTPAGKAVDLRADIGVVEGDVEIEARSVDMIVMGRPSNLDARDALHAALFRTERLVLVVPVTAAGVASLGRRIVIGWKPTDQARRAVEMASPWLRAADEVTVVSVDKPGTPSYEPSARDLFGRLGIEARFVMLHRDGRSVAAQLLAEAHRLDGDCLLIGAYHHGPLWEAVLGGVTRDVLAQLDLPVFMRR